MIYFINFKSAYTFAFTCQSRVPNEIYVYFLLHIGPCKLDYIFQILY